MKVGMRCIHKYPAVTQYSFLIVTSPDCCRRQVEGCCHGELDAIYSHICELEMHNNYTVDALLICGDFEAVRNHQDLECMSVPKKYKKMVDFHK